MYKSRIGAVYYLESSPLYAPYSWNFLFIKINKILGIFKIPPKYIMGGIFNCDTHLLISMPFWHILS